MITTSYPTSNAGPAPTDTVYSCFAGLCSRGDHYTGCNNNTFSLSSNRHATNDKKEQTDHHSICSFKYQHPQQVSFLEQDVGAVPRPELDASPTSVRQRPPDDEVSEGDDCRDIGTRPVMGGCVLGPSGSFNGSFDCNVQDHHSYVDTAPDSRGTPQSHYVDPHYQHEMYDGMRISSLSTDSAGSVPPNGFPSPGNRIWDNRTANEGYDIPLGAEYGIVDFLGTTVDSQNPQDDGLCSPDSVTMWYEPAGEWNPSGERAPPPHQVGGENRMPHLRIPYERGVPFQEDSGTTSNASAPLHSVSSSIAFQSESHRNTHTQQLNRYHTAIPIITPVQEVGPNILPSIPEDFIDYYPVGGRQNQGNILIPGYIGSRNLIRSGEEQYFVPSQRIGDHDRVWLINNQSFPVSAPAEFTNHSTASGEQQQERLAPSVPIALSNAEPTAEGMLYEPSTLCVASNSSPLQNNDPLVHSCPWRVKVGIVCGEQVTSEMCATHLASHHGIKTMSSNRIVKCRACQPPKEMKRESILRHFIEVHLKIKRKPSRGKGKKNKKCSASSSQPDARMMA